MSNAPSSWVATVNGPDWPTRSDGAALGTPPGVAVGRPVGRPSVQLIAVTAVTIAITAATATSRARLTARVDVDLRQLPRRSRESRSPNREERVEVDPRMAGRPDD